MRGILNGNGICGCIYLEYTHINNLLLTSTIKGHPMINSVYYMNRSARHNARLIQSHNKTIEILEHERRKTTFRRALYAS